MHFAIRLALLGTGACALLRDYMRYENETITFFTPASGRRDGHQRPGRREIIKGVNRRMGIVDDDTLGENVSASVCRRVFGVYL